jgi:hypothetical protein
MTMADGTEQSTSTAVESTAPGPEATQTAPPAGGVNPAWESLRSEVGDPTFHLLQPHLKKWDEEATGRVTRANEELKRYTELGDFDTLKNGSDFVRQLEEDPEGFAHQLVNLLQEQGRWAEAAAVEATIDDESEGGEEEPDPRDVRLAALEEAAQAVETQKQYDAWNSEWETAFAAAKDKNPWLADEDDDLLRTFAGNHIQSDDDPIAGIFAKSLDDLSKFRDRTVATQRPGTGAPRLIPGGGGNPAAAQPVDVAKLGRTDTQKLVADIIKARQG